MDEIVRELKTTQTKKYNIKKLLKKYDKDLNKKLDEGDIDAEPTNSLHIMYTKALMYYHQNKILRKQNQKLKDRIKELENKVELENK